MAKLPAFQFYPGDWMKDPNLKRCSHTAKGVWIDMLCLMFECDERGILASGGDAWTLDEIACAVGGAQDVSLAGIHELLAKGVASRNSVGAIFSRRLVRDEHIRTVRAKAGSKGGSKTSSKKEAKRKQTTEDEDEDEDEDESGSGEGGLGETKTDDPPFPDDLATDNFRAAWDDWTAYRREARLKAYVPRGIKQQLKRLKEFGHDRAIAAIDHSIAQQFQGIYEPSGRGAGRTSSETAAAQRRADKAQREYPEPDTPLPIIGRPTRRADENG